MTNEGLSRWAYRTLDALTDSAPGVVPRIFERVFLALMGNRVTQRVIRKRYVRALAGVGSYRSILIVADMGIGDSIFLQGLGEVVRQFFPDSRIDYACSANGAQLVPTLPGIDSVLGIFSRPGHLEAHEERLLRKIDAQVQYSVVFNFCPFISPRSWRPNLRVLDLYVPFAARVIQRWDDDNAHLHVSTALPEFVRGILAEALRQNSGPVFSLAHPRVSGRRLSRIYLSDAAISQANTFLAHGNVLGEDGLIFLHPDASSQYTAIPLEIQEQIVNDLARSPLVSRILIGPGFRIPDVPQQLRASLPAGLQEKVLTVPAFPLPVFAAIVDACDYFISGDGGTLHIAAAWKLSTSRQHQMRNRTSIIGVFGATDARMYGYDSERTGFAEASQLAPSRSFISSAPCRNITCINKLGKSCSDVRCFAGLGAGAIAEYVLDSLRSIQQTSALSR